jgi:hypothetical protein
MNLSNGSSTNEEINLYHHWDETGFPQINWRFSFPSLFAAVSPPNDYIISCLRLNNELNPHSFLFSFIDLFSLPFLASAFHPARNCSLRIPFLREKIHARNDAIIIKKRTFILQLYFIRHWYSNIAKSSCHGASGDWWRYEIISLILTAWRELRN